MDSASRHNRFYSPVVVASVSGALILGAWMAPVATGVATADSGCPAAASGFTFGDGAGSPYQIDSMEELQLLKDDPTYWDDSFILTSNVDMSGCTWSTAVGDVSSAFTGTFDGRGYSITNVAVTVTSNTGDALAGIFGRATSGASLVDLTVSGAIIAETIAGGRYAIAGGIVGQADSVTISDVSFTGSVTAESTADHPYAGGIVGEGIDVDISSVNVRANVSAAPVGRAAAGGVAGALSARSPGTASIDKASVAGSIFTESGVQASSGGIAGWTGSIEITRSFADVKVRADNGSEPAAGGIVGGGSANVTDSYARGDIVGTRMVGGIIGWSRQADAVNFALRNSYFTGTLTLNSGDRRALGGLVGRGDYLSTVDYQAPGSVWNQESSGVPDAIGYTEYIDGGGTLDPVAAGALASSTSGMTTESTYTNAGWSIDAAFNLGLPWNICGGYQGGFPFLSAVAGTDPCSLPTPAATPSSQTITGLVGAAVQTLPVQASFGDAFFTVEPALPSTLTLDVFTGTISGQAPYSATERTFTLRALSVSQPLQSVTSAVTQQASPAPTISPTLQNISGTVGDSVLTTAFTVTGLPSPTFSISPSLPSGLTLNPSTGVISGTIQSTSRGGTYVITASSPSTPQTVTSTVEQPPGPLWPNQISQFDVRNRENGGFQAMADGPPNGDSLVLTYGQFLEGGTTVESYYTYLIDANGEVLNGPTDILPDDFALSSYYQPAVAYNPVTGGWLACFTKRVDPGRSQPYCTYLGVDGSAESDPFALSDIFTDQWNQNAIAYADDSEMFLVAATSYGNDSEFTGPIGRFVSADGFSGTVGDVLAFDSGMNLAQRGGLDLAYSTRSKTFGLVTRAENLAEATLVPAPWLLHLDSSGTVTRDPQRLLDDTSIVVSNGSVAYDASSDSFMVVGFDLGTGWNRATGPLLAQGYDAETGAPHGGGPIVTPIDGTVYSDWGWRPLIAAHDDTTQFMIVSPLELSASGALGVYSFYLDEDGVVSAPSLIAGDDTMPAFNRPRVVFNSATCEFVSTYTLDAPGWDWQLFSARASASAPCESDFPSGPPRNASASAGNSSALIRWLEPSASGSSPITSYVVTARPGGASCLAIAPALACEVEGLSNGTAYSFTVRARNGSGLSPMSQPTNAVTPSATNPSPGPGSPPSAPLNAAATAGDRVAIVTWTAPLEPGSSALSFYQVTATPGGATCLATAPARSCTVTGLANGASYTFRVRALNAAGWGAHSEPSNAVTPRKSAEPSMVITGYRGTGKDVRRVYVVGTAVDMDGRRVTAYMRFPGQTNFTPGSTTRIVTGGQFAWSRKASKRMTVYFDSGDVRSNRIVIAAR